MRQPVSHFDQYAERDEGFELVGEERADETEQRDRRLPAIALTLGVMVLFAGGLWFAYVQGTRHAAAPGQGDGGVPLIRADERPTKVKPEDPGGMPVPDRNVSLYNDHRGKPLVEKLLPPPEQPMPRPAPPPPPPPPQAAAPAPPAETAPPVVSREPQTAPAKPNANAAAEPKAPAPPKPSAQQKTASLAPANPAPSGKVQVRLGSLRSPEAARQEWTRLKRENADLLGGLTANAVAVDLGERGIYYRIVAGPFADAAAAERLCGEMKRRNRGCILAR